MSHQTLTSQFAAAEADADPFQVLYALAKSLRDRGLPRPDLYRIFVSYYRRCPDDDPFAEMIGDVLDYIWGGGWGKAALELYETPLSKDDLKSYVVDELEDYDGWLQALE
ncbi:hypothetical protein [Gimesia sp.]|uniref:hypothetical protein n=1 Tax=Gimesia sp. TaxID=2024833 RepID=UPI003A92E313